MRRLWRLVNERTLPFTLTNVSHGVPVYPRPQLMLQCQIILLGDRGAMGEWLAQDISVDSEPNSWALDLDYKALVTTPPSRNNNNVISPNSTWLVTSRLDTTRTFDVSSAFRRARRAVLFDKLDTAKMHGLGMSNVSSRVKTWRDEPSGIWAITTVWILYT